MAPRNSGEFRYASLRIRRADSGRAKVAGRHGGTGRTAPWDLLARFDPGVPVLLAGGLTAENVAEAIARGRPFAVDVASGVESEPGIKDEEKLRRFMERALG
ncbi:MAG: phosphoribosylanthranilate isomerase [Gemmataceae bacterium]